jgi:DNA mismatch repair ATPase MutS
MLCDRLFTHFERQENIATLAGKLEEELQRVHAILEQAGGRSVVVMNESFSSTSLHDAFVIGRAVIGQLVESDLLCVYVTFIDELSRLSPATVSMVSSIDVADPATRTFKILRRPADGLAYAAALAAKYRLGSDQVGERLRG